MTREFIFRVFFPEPYVLRSSTFCKPTDIVVTFYKETVFRQDWTVLWKWCPNFDEISLGGCIHRKKWYVALQNLFWPLGCFEIVQKPKNMKNQVFEGIDKLGSRSKVPFQCLSQSQYQRLSQSLTWTLELVTIIAMPPPDSRRSPAYSRRSLLKLFWELSENILTILGFLMSMTLPGFTLPTECVSRTSCPARIQPGDGG